MFGNGYRLLCTLYVFLLLAKNVLAVIEREYNAVNYKLLNSYEQFVDQYVVDGKLTQNVFLGLATKECWHYLDAPAFRGTQRHAAEGAVDSVALDSSTFPFGLEKCAQILFYHIGDPVEQPFRTTDEFEHFRLNRWVSSCLRMENFVIANDFDFTVAVYFMEESADPVLQTIMPAGHFTKIGTFISHTFSASKVNPVDGSSDPYVDVVDFFMVSGSEYRMNPQNRLETCELVQKNSFEARFSGENVQLKCEDMDKRLIEFTHHVWHLKRIGLNYVQPQVVRPVTESGFDHRRLPDQTYQWLKAWYDNEKLISERAEHAVGPCMNQHVAPSGVTHITPELKERLSTELKDILEDWYGGPLTLTSIYGIRKYNNGSVLRMHVDTVNTHVVSAIINVDQEVEKDWPLLILDHEDNEHNLVMQPGDMVLYESAKLLHGRPEPFKGTHYDNIFIHYKPVEGWNYDGL